MAECKDGIGNCTEQSDDGLPAQCVGPWAEDKHVYISRYVDVCAPARAKFLGPGKAGAAFIDPFSGPGRARTRTSGQFIDGSPLIALKQEKAPFSRVVLCDLAAVNTSALAQRTSAHARRRIILTEDCNEKVDELISHVPRHGLNVALVDAYGLTPLSFETIKKLAALPRMDLIINFPTNDMKRNLDREETKERIDRFLGTTAWRVLVKRPE
jgi:three-Cys-motif partner protein